MTGEKTRRGVFKNIILPILIAACIVALWAAGIAVYMLFGGNIGERTVVYDNPEGGMNFSDGDGVSLRTMYPWKLYYGCEAFDYSANSDVFCPDADALAYALARTIMAPVNGESISLDMSRAKVARLASGEDVYSFLSGAAVVFGDGTRSAFSAALCNGSVVYFEFGETDDRELDGEEINDAYSRLKEELSTGFLNYDGSYWGLYSSDLGDVYKKYAELYPDGDCSDGMLSALGIDGPLSMLFFKLGCVDMNAGCCENTGIIVSALLNYGVCDMTYSDGCIYITAMGDAQTAVLKYSVRLRRITGLTIFSGNPAGAAEGDVEQKKSETTGYSGYAGTNYIFLT